MIEERGRKIKVIKSDSHTKVQWGLYSIIWILYIMFLLDFIGDDLIMNSKFKILIQIMVYILGPIFLVLISTLFKFNDIVLYENGLTPNLGGYDRIVYGKDFFLHFNSIKSIHYIKEVSTLPPRLKFHRFEITFKPNRFLPQFADNKEDYDLIKNTYNRSKS